VIPPPGPVRWVDNHCHLEPATAAADVAEAAEAGVDRVITVGTDAVTSEAAIVTARRLAGAVFATVGVHPHEARFGLDGIEPLLDASEVVAVGECGLDFHYDHSPRDVQRAVFAAQIALARRRDLPLVVHTREAWRDTFAILDREGLPGTIVFHCFTGGADEARDALDRGAHLSFSGIVTFPKAEAIRAAAALCPIDRILVETDAPYLAPVPHRGRPNRPAWVALVGAALARLRSVDIEELAAATSANAERVYRLGS
jgi:TatD DNase family protein